MVLTPCHQFWSALCIRGTGVSVERLQPQATRVETHSTIDASDLGKSIIPDLFDLFSQSFHHSIAGDVN